jgi:hypothetical protein
MGLVTHFFNKFGRKTPAAPKPKTATPADEAEAKARESRQMAERAKRMTFDEAVAEVNGLLTKNLIDSTRPVVKELMSRELAFEERKQLCVLLQKIADRTDSHYNVLELTAELQHEFFKLFLYHPNDEKEHEGLLAQAVEYCKHPPACMGSRDYPDSCFMPDDSWCDDILAAKTKSRHFLSVQALIARNKERISRGFEVDSKTGRLT